MCLIASPLLGATLIAVSRVSDYRHHWQDVVIGGLVGIFLALCGYTLYFKSPFRKVLAPEKRPYLIALPLGPPLLLQSQEASATSSQDTLCPLPDRALSKAPLNLHSIV